MKITKCDRCGKEFVGRNPEGFYEHVFDKRVYIDLCDECEPKYNNILQSMEVHNRRVLEQFLNSLKGGNNNEQEFKEDGKELTDGTTE